MKLIGIDARLYSQTGVGTYLRNLLTELEKREEEYRIRVYLTRQDFSKVTFKNPLFTTVLADYRWHSFSEQLGFYSQLMKDNLNLMHFTYFGYPVRYTKRFIATVHDITPLTHKTGRASTRNPLLYELKHGVFSWVLRNQVSNARNIIVPSETVKKELTRLYGATIGAKTHVIYEGMNAELVHAKIETSKDKKPETPFFLYVGNFYPHKNIDRLIAAFKAIPEPYKLALVGPDDVFAKKIKVLVKNEGLEQRIHFYYNLTPSELAFFYTNAEALIHPSLAEGFGLPLIEASHFRLPIIASDMAVFKEIAGNNYYSFDPYSTESIVQAVDIFLSESNKKLNPVDETFSFSQMAEKTLKLYKKTLEIRD